MRAKMECECANSQTYLNITVNSCTHLFQTEITLILHFSWYYFHYR